MVLFAKELGIPFLAHRPLGGYAKVEKLKKNKVLVPSLVPDQGPNDSPEVVLLMGIQGAGKTELVQTYVDQGYARLNRDVIGGKVDDLNGHLERLLAEVDKRVVLDNTYPTRISRARVVRIAHQAGVPVRCRFLQTSIKEARTPVEHTVKGLLLDVDGTLRTTLSGEIYPRHADDVVLLPNRRETLSRWIDDGYSLFFVSNQSGVSLGKLSQADADGAFQRTIDLLGLPVQEVCHCPHPAFPVGCFCRKPMLGQAIYLSRKYKLDMAQLVMVGDMDSDAGFARSISARYVDASVFFAR